MAFDTKEIIKDVWVTDKKTNKYVNLKGRVISNIDIGNKKKANWFDVKKVLQELGYIVYSLTDQQIK